MVREKVWRCLTPYLTNKMLEGLLYVAYCIVVMFVILTHPNPVMLRILLMLPIGPIVLLMLDRYTTMRGLMCMNQVLLVLVYTLTLYRGDIYQNLFYCMPMWLGVGMVSQIISEL